MTTYSWKTPASGDWATASLWMPNGGPPDSATSDAVIAAAGSYAVTLAAADSFTVDSLTLSGPAAMLDLNGVLRFGNAALLSLQAGTIALRGTIKGATLAETGGAIQYDGGTLDGATVRGTLDLSADNATLTVKDGIALTGADGSGSGSIRIGNTNTLAVVGNTTLDHVAILLDYGSLLGSGTNAVLTLGADVTLGNTHFSTSDFTVGTGYLSDGGQAGDKLVNLGTIEATDTIFQIAGNSFDNEGLITVSSGGSLIIDPKHFTNFGRIDVSMQFGADSGGGLWLAPGWSNDGTIEVTGGALYLGFDPTTYMIDSTTPWGDIGSFSVTDAAIVLGGRFTTAQYRLLALGNQSVFIIGNIINTGNTLTDGKDFLSGFYIGVPDGTITGGTVVTNSNVFADGTLSGVTVRGPLLLGLYNAGGGQLTVTDGIMVTDAAGTGPGSIDISEREALYLVGTTTLDHATITMHGGASSIRYFGSLLEGQDTTQGGATLTLGPSLVASTGNGGGGGYVSDGGGPSDRLVNEGLIRAANGGAMAIGGNRFFNQGMIAIGDAVAYGQFLYSDSATIESAHWDNLIGTTLSIGSYSVGVDGVLELPANVTIATLDATVTLSGTGSVIESLNAATQTEIPLESTLSTIARYGRLLLQHGRVYAAGNGFADNGQLVLVNGTFADTNTLSIGATGTLFGNGLVAAPIANVGTIEAAGGLLILADPVSGGGTLRVDPGGEMDLKANIFAGTILDRGTIRLVGYTAAAFSTQVAAGARLIGVGSVNAVANAGTLESQGGRLLLAGGASGTGALLAESGTTLELAAATSAGTATVNGTLKLDGFAVSITSTNIFAAGRIDGFGTFLGPIADSGGITAAGGLLTLGSVTGGGGITIDNAATLALTASMSLDVIFASGGMASLRLDAQTGFSGVIKGLALADSLVFKNEIVSSAMLSGSTLTVGGSAGIVQYQVAGALSGNHFAVTDPHTLVLAAGSA